MFKDFKTITTDIATEAVFLYRSRAKEYATLLVRT